MKVESLLVVMAGRSAAAQEHLREESLVFWTGGERGGRPGSLPNPGAGGIDKLELSPAATAILQKPPAQQEIELELSEKDKQKILILQKLLSALTGRKVKLIVPRRLVLRGSCGIDRPGRPAAGNPAPRRLGWGMVYSYHERYRETEMASFTARGVVKTADGREVEFEVRLNLSREFIAESNINLRLGDARLSDPLVINYQGPAAEITSSRFEFDLDRDGRPEQIPFVTPGSGFLALDLDGDGAVNDGGELFGPSTGDGLAELAGYDSDNNRWIDENDPVFDRLRIWTRDEQGNDRLLALGQAGVGAIYLGGVELPFSYKDESNKLMGVSRKAGIFLRENGTAGTVQQLDLVT